MDRCLALDGEQMDKLVYSLILRGRRFCMPSIGNGNEATIDDFAPIVGEICNKEIMQISTCADSCFAIAGVY